MKYWWVVDSALVNGAGKYKEIIINVKHSSGVHQTRSVYKLFSSCCIANVTGDTAFITTVDYFQLSWKIRTMCFHWRIIYVISILSQSNGLRRFRLLSRFFHNLYLREREIRIKKIIKWNIHMRKFDSCSEFGKKEIIAKKVVKKEKENV